MLKTKECVVHAILPVLQPDGEVQAFTWTCLEGLKMRF